jgi:hypothetical protein
MAQAMPWEKSHLAVSPFSFFLYFFFQKAEDRASNIIEPCNILIPKPVESLPMPHNAEPSPSKCLP